MTPMTAQDEVWANVANLFGSDPETPEEHELLRLLHDAAERSHNEETRA